MKGRHLEFIRKVPYTLLNEKKTKKKHFDDLINELLDYPVMRSVIRVTKILHCKSRTKTSFIY